MSRTCVGHALPTQIDFDAKETGIDPEPGEMARDKAVQVIDDLARVSRGRDFLPDEAVDAASEQGGSDTMTGHVADAEKELVVVRFEKAAVIASDDVMFLATHRDLHAFIAEIAWQHAPVDAPRQSPLFGANRRRRHVLRGRRRTMPDTHGFHTSVAG